MGTEVASRNAGGVRRRGSWGEVSNVGRSIRDWREVSRLNSLALPVPLHFAGRFLSSPNPEEGLFPLQFTLCQLLTRKDHVRFLEAKSASNCFVSKVLYFVVLVDLPMLDTAFILWYPIKVEMIEILYGAGTYVA